jgi:TatD DNase family protein
VGERAAALDDRHGQPDLPARRAGGPGLSRRRIPERLPGLVDSHAHLQHERFDADRDAVIARAVEAGIERICVPGWDIASSEAALDIASRHRSVIDAAVGVHPHHAAEMDERAWGRLEELVADSRTRAVGEIGLDFFRNLSPPEVQREALARQLAIAKANDLPVLVHDREAHDAVTAALVAWAGRGMLHAFSGDAEMARRLVDAGFVVSFALPVSFGSAVGPRAAAAALPDGSFLVETDSPYLGPDAPRRNEPTTVLRVIAELGRLRGTDPEALVAPIRAAYGGVMGPPSG